MHEFFKHAVEISNPNINGNANHLLRKLSKDLSIISSGLANLKINMTKTNFDWDINLFLDD